MNRRISDIEQGLSTAPPAEALAEAVAPEAAPPASVSPRSPANLELSGRLAGLSLPRQVFVLALWPFLEQVLNFLVGFVDTSLAGHLNIEAANAVGGAAYIGWLMNMMQMSVGIGATAIITRAIGGRHRRVANAALGQAMVMSLVVGALSGALIYLAAPAMCDFMELRGLARAYALDYLRILALSALVSSVFFVGSACLRASGDTRSPFIVLSVINVVNAAASYLLVYGPPPLGGREVAGIALGTALAWGVGAVLMVVALAMDGGAIRLRLIRLRPHWHTMKRILRVAAASLLESLGMWLGNFAVITIVGIVGIQQKAAMGAHTIAVRLEAISYLPCMALGMAASTLTGQYLGLGDPHRARRAALMCWRFGIAMMGVMGLAFLLIPAPLVKLVTKEESLLALAPDLLRICGPVQVFFGTAIVLSNAMRGAGDTRTTMRLTYFSIYFVRVPLTYLLAIGMGLGLNGVWFALCGELVVRGLIFGLRFRQGGWQRVAV